MTEPSPFEPYLHRRATSLTVPAGAPDRVIERARARRRRRQVGGTAAVGALALLGGVVAVGAPNVSDEPDQTVASYAAGSIASTLTWTEVGPVDGLGWSLDSATVDSGSIYSLSTAASSNDPAQRVHRRLYRSADGDNWTQVPGPDGLRVASLAASGDTLYAVGTGSAGGTVRVATSTSAQAWTTEDLPLDLDAIGAGLPGEVTVTDLEVATLEDRTVVAARVSLRLDPTDVLPEGFDESRGWWWNTTADGLVVGVVSGDLASDDMEGGDLRTWADLGLPEEIGPLVQGQLHLFAAEGDGPFTAVATHDDGGHDHRLVTGPDGFWVLSGGQTGAGVTARFSPDGTDWAADPVTLPGWLSAAGTVAGHLQVITGEHETTGSESFEGRTRFAIHRLTPTGVASTDLDDVVGSSGASFVSAAGMGPLGLALVVTDAEGAAVLHSVDGVGFSSTPLPEAPEGHRFTVPGITVTADAVKVRLNLYAADDHTGEDPLAQHLFVGTPS